MMFSFQILLQPNFIEEKIDLGGGRAASMDILFPLLKLSRQAYSLFGLLIGLEDMAA
jgi:hypothetical protein